MTSLVLLLLAVEPAAPSSAPDPGGEAAVFVLPADAAGALAQRLPDALAAAGVQVLDVDKRFPPSEPENVGAALATEARKAYDDLDLELSLAKADEAIAWFEEHPAVTRADELAQLLVLKAASLVQNGGKKAMRPARDALTQALLADPDLELDEQIAGPEVTRLVAVAKNDIAQRATADLKLSTLPPGATVFFHGKAIGVTPMPPIRGLRLGRHYVRFHRPGYAPDGAVVDLSAEGAEVAMDLVITPAWADANAKAKVLWSEGSASTVATLAADTGSRFVVVAQVTGGGDDAQLSLRAWDSVTGGRLEEAKGPATAEGLKALARQVKSFTANPSPVKVAAAGPAEPLKLPPVLKKWWFWAAVGGAVVAGTATAVAVSSQPHGRPYNVVLNLP